jgi:hypothetical protein
VELPGAWSVAGILSLRSGEPVNLVLGADANDDGDTIDRPALLSGQVSDLYDASGAGTQFLVPRDRAIQVLGAASAASDPFAVVPRNALVGPRIWYYDLSLVKRLQLTSRARLSLEVNAFNVSRDSDASCRRPLVRHLDRSSLVRGCPSSVLARNGAPCWYRRDGTGVDVENPCGGEPTRSPDRARSQWGSARLSSLPGNRSDPSVQRSTTASQHGPATVTGFGTSTRVSSRHAAARSTKALA